MNLKFDSDYYTPGIDGLEKVNLEAVCPNCNTFNLFTYLKRTVQVNENTLLSFHLCIKCKHLLIGVQVDDKIVRTYPSSIFVKIDTTGIPEKIITTLQEGLLCFSNECYTASAILIRKTIEIICDENNAQGSNLKERIKQLKVQTILPDDLMDAMDDLRLLGNDAAHISSTTFDTIGVEELSVSIRIIQSVLHSIYQTRELLNDIRKLKTIQ